MDVIALTAFLTPFLPFLIKFGEKSAESVATKFGEDSWNKAKKVWDKLHPKVEAKEDAKFAAQQLAAKPDNKNRKALFEEELEILLKENPDLVEAIAQIMQEKLSDSSASGTQNRQTNTNNKGQAINQMTGEKVIGHIGSIQGDFNF